MSINYSPSKYDAYMYIHLKMYRYTLSRSYIPIFDRDYAHRRKSFDSRNKLTNRIGRTKHRNAQSQFLLMPIIRNTVTSGSLF